MLKIIFYLFCITFSQQFSLVFASDGDRSPFYQNCVRRCLSLNCTEDKQDYTKEAVQQYDLGIWFLQWNCWDDCRYYCMWKTVHGFKERGFPVPKFHGKWPFVRMMGIQEPASVLASLLNLAAHFYMHWEVRRKFSMKKIPLMLLWHIFAIVCMNAWVWSSIFHMRDTPFTEFMDYACALSMVMAILISAIVRICYKRTQTLTGGVLVSIPLVYYATHVHYLYSGVIDYDYNMIVNVSVGVFGCLVWMIWAWLQFCAGQLYTWRLTVFTLLTGVTVSLELLDFPPKYYFWDAHALWHLSTVPLTPMFYKFVIDDLKYLEETVKKEDHSKTK